MDSSYFIALLMIACIVLICYGIAYIHKRENKAKEREQLGAFNRIVVTNEIHVSNREQFRDRIIALDTHKKILLFFDNLQEDKASIIDLTNAATCSVVKISEAGYYKKENAATNQVVHSVALEVASHKHDKIKKFMFYDLLRDSSMDIIPLTNRAEYWKKLVCQTAGIK